MSGLVFVDTNVLLYAVDVGDKRKHDAAMAWRRRLWETRQGRVSFQVLQEFYANVFRKWPQSLDSARVEILDLFAWQPVVISAEILKSSWKIQDRYGISFWDALIVAAAKSSNCSFLLSEDFQSAFDFGGLRVINPFRAQPNDIIPPDL